VFAEYHFPSGSNRGFWHALDNASIQLGVKNVFNTSPPFDYASALPYSAYGDLRLASYWFSLKKNF